MRYYAKIRNLKLKLIGFTYAGVLVKWGRIRLAEDALWMWVNVGK